jgi:hypothetical protein
MNDPYNSLVIEVQTHLTKINEKINTICNNLDKLEEKLINMEIKLEANKLVNNEKNENNNYKLSVLEEKINGNNQKVNDLNNIMMKHFAYKSNNNNLHNNIPQNNNLHNNIPQNNIYYKQKQNRNNYNRSSKQICHFFRPNVPNSCRNGNDCDHLHVTNLSNNNKRYPKQQQQSH